MIQMAKGNTHIYKSLTYRCLQLDFGIYEIIYYIYIYDCETFTHISMIYVLAD